MPPSPSTPPAVLVCQSLGPFNRFPIVAMPLYQLLIYGGCTRLRYVVSAAWDLCLSTVAFEKQFVAVSLGNSVSGQHEVLRLRTRDCISSTRFFLRRTDYNSFSYVVLVVAHTMQDLCCLCYMGPGRLRYGILVASAMGSWSPPLWDLSRLCYGILVASAMGSWSPPLRGILIASATLDLFPLLRRQQLLWLSMSHLSYIASEQV